jgi:hypothetical protein
MGPVPFVEIRLAAALCGVRGFFVGEPVPEDLPHLLVAAVEVVVAFAAQADDVALGVIAEERAAFPDDVVRVELLAAAARAALADLRVQDLRPPFRGCDLAAVLLPPGPGALERVRLPVGSHIGHRATPPPTSRHGRREHAHEATRTATPRGASVRSRCSRRRWSEHGGDRHAAPWSAASLVHGRASSRFWRGALMLLSV